MIPTLCTVQDTADFTPKDADPSRAALAFRPLIDVSFSKYLLGVLLALSRYLKRAKH